MPDSFVFAAPPDPKEEELLETWGEMLGSVYWEHLAHLGKLLTGTLWDLDDLEDAGLEGDEIVVRLPGELTTRLAEVRDDQLAELADSWHQRLRAEYPGDWKSPEDAQARRENLEGLRGEARQALARGGALWLRTEL